MRRIVLGASPMVREGIKWNSASYKTSDWFATIHLRSRDSVQLVLHRGAKAKDGSRRMAIEDPEGLLRWLSTDRCLVTVGSGGQIAARRPALRAIVRGWIAQL